MTGTPNNELGSQVTIRHSFVVNKRITTICHAASSCFVLTVDVVACARTAVRYYGVVGKRACQPGLFPLSRRGDPSSHTVL
jgi:hypothetical protein